MKLSIGKYLEAHEAPVEPRMTTKRWSIRSRTQGSVLGYVAWFPRWRQYTFDPRAETTFNAVCLTDIARFLDRVNREHHEAKRGEGATLFGRTSS